MCFNQKIISLRLIKNYQVLKIFLLVERYLKNQTIIKKNMKHLFPLLVIFLLMVISCSKDEKFNSPTYSEAELKIGIVGEKPKIREENISLIMGYHLPFPDAIS